MRGQKRLHTDLENILLPPEQAHLYEAAEKGNSLLIKELLKDPRVARYLNQEYIFHTPLMIAVLNNHQETVITLLDHKAEINQKSSYNNETVIMQAVKDPSVKADIIKILLAYKVNILGLRDQEGKDIFSQALEKRGKASDILPMLLNHEEKNGDPPLILHVKNPHTSPQKLQIFLHLKADVNLQNKAGDTALMWAVKTNPIRSDVIKMLLGYRAAVNLRNKEGSTALIDAIKNPGITPDVVKMLLAHNAEVNVYDKSEQTTLQYAFRNCNIPIDVIKILLEHKATINLPNRIHNTLLTAAIATTPHIRLEEVIDTLLEYKENINGFSGFSDTPLLRAIYYEHSPDVIKILIDRKANVNVSGYLSMTPLGAAIEHLPASTLDVVKMLLDHKAELNQKNRYGESALALAFYCSYRPIPTEAIKMLLEHKADVNAKDDHGDSVLIHAVKHPQITEDIIALLLSNKADTSIALTRAVTHPNITANMIEMLLDAKADVNLQDEKGNTALTQAVTNPHITTHIIRMLLEAKADINSQNKNNDNALTMALTNSNLSVNLLELLIQRKANMSIQNKWNDTPFMRARMVGKEKMLLTALENSVKSKMIEANTFTQVTSTYHATITQERLDNLQDEAKVVWNKSGHLDLVDLNPSKLTFNKTPSNKNIYVIKVYLNEVVLEDYCPEEGQRHPRIYSNSTGYVAIS